MNTSNADFGYEVKYSLLNIDLSNKKSIMASVKYLLKLNDPELDKLIIFSNNATISSIYLEGVKMGFSLGINRVNMVLPKVYQVDEFSILEIKFKTNIVHPWLLITGSNIPTIENYYNVPINELKVTAHSDKDFITDSAMLMSTEELPKKYIYHYAIKDNNTPINLSL
jgi:hypothetical protein